MPFALFFLFCFLLHHATSYSFVWHYQPTSPDPLPEQAADLAASYDLPYPHPGDTRRAALFPAWGSAWLFGAESTCGCGDALVWQFHFENMTWSYYELDAAQRATGARTEVNYPGVRADAATVACGDDIWTYGGHGWGMTVRASQGDTWSWNRFTKIWTYYLPPSVLDLSEVDEVVPSDTHPGTRTNMGFAAIGDSLYVFGGVAYGAFLLTRSELFRLWEWDTISLEWSFVSGPESFHQQGEDFWQVYPGRTMFSQGQTLFIFGLTDDSDTQRVDIVKYDTSQPSPVWELVHNFENTGTPVYYEDSGMPYGSTVRPFLAAGSSYALDELNNFVYFFQAQSAQSYMGVWRFDLSSLEWWWTGIPKAFDTENPIALPPNFEEPEVHPGARKDAMSMMFGSRLYIFGGLDVLGKSRGDLFWFETRCVGGTQDPFVLCSGNGICNNGSRDDGVCECNENWRGLACDSPWCFEYFHDEQTPPYSACSNHGYCASVNCCVCETGFGGERCDLGVCYGILETEADVVCSGHGTCNLGGSCSCNAGEYTGSECDIPVCFGISASDATVCSGHGTCHGPDLCSCVEKMGDECDEKLPSDPLTSGEVGGIVGGVIAGCVVVVLGLIGLFVLILLLQRRVLSQKAQLSTFNELKDFDILLQEQKAEERSGNAAKVKVNRDFFQCAYEEIALIEEIGRGGSGATGKCFNLLLTFSVYKATYHGTTIAVKIFRFQAFGSMEVGDFEKEVELMLSLNHPNLLQCYGCTLKEPRVGILLEYCEGGTLSSYLSLFRNDATFGERVGLACGVLSGLGFLHSKNVIHRDIKSENILIASGGIPKIIDFGLSRIMVKGNSKMTMKIGTSVYMAPEVTLGKVYGFPADIYSMSIVLFEILTSNFEPFGMNVAAIEIRVAQDPNTRPKWDSIYLDDPRFLPYVELVERMWAADSATRPSAEDVRAELQSISVSLGGVGGGGGGGGGGEPGPEVRPMSSVNRRNHPSSSVGGRFTDPERMKSGGDDDLRETVRLMQASIRKLEEEVWRLKQDQQQRNSVDV